MEPVVLDVGSGCLMPECLFTPPEGKVFVCWDVGGVDYAPDGWFRCGEAGTVTVRAVWDDPVPTLRAGRGAEGLRYAVSGVPRNESCRLLAASYGSGGRMTGVGLYTVAPGEGLLPFPGEGRCRLYLLSGGWIPLCAPWEEPQEASE